MTLTIPEFLISGLLWVAIIIGAIWAIGWLWGWVYFMFIDGFDERGIDVIRWSLHENQSKKKTWGPFIGNLIGVPIMTAVMAFFAWPMVVFGG